MDPGNSILEADGPWMVSASVVPAIMKLIAVLSNTLVKAPGFLDTVSVTCYYSATHAKVAYLGVGAIVVG